jgi:DNA-binding PadR family transcriptional regulator
MKGDHIGEFEELVLLAVKGLQGSAYGVSVQQRLEASTARGVSIGAVYAALDRLEAKGLVRSRMAPGSPVRGGRGRRVFAATAAGASALAEMQRVRDRLRRTVAARPAAARGRA